MISIGAMYHLIPILYGKKQGEMYSTRLIDLHFWLSTIGTVLYIASMWVNGLMQGLMWRAFIVNHLYGQGVFATHVVTTLSSKFL